MIRNKIIITAFLFAALIAAGLWAVFSIEDSVVRAADIRGISTPGDAEADDYVYRITWSYVPDAPSEKYEDSFIRVKGYIAKKGEEINEQQFFLVFKDLESGRCYKVPTMMEKTDDKALGINDDIDHTYSGFEARVGQGGIIDAELHDYKLYGIYILNRKEILIDFDYVL